MDEPIAFLVALFPIAIWVLTLLIKYTNKPTSEDELQQDTGVKEHLQLNEIQELRQTYASISTERLAPLYMEEGVKDEARELVWEELKSRGCKQERATVIDTPFLH